MNPTNSEIASFYDAHSQRLLRDFVCGNPRVNAAIELVVQMLSGRSGRILDVGCGIGTTSYSYCSRLKDFHVDGLDISPAAIEIARRLFQCDRLTFSVSDMSKPIDQPQYDAVVLVDVYEHIPQEQRVAFNQVLANSLSPQGTLVLTAPSVLHQEYLRNHEAAGLQIVDEDVDLSTIQDLATAISGTVTYFAYKTVWRTNQYLHVVIERSPQYEPRSYDQNGQISPLLRKFATLRERLKRRSTNSLIRERSRLVKDRLGIEIEV